MNKIKKVGNTPILTAVVDVAKSELQELSTEILTRMKTGVVLLCFTENDQCQILVRVSQDLVNQGIHANTLIKSISQFIELLNHCFELLYFFFIHMERLHK